MLLDFKSWSWGFVCSLGLLVTLSACTARRPAGGMAAFPEECMVLRADSAHTAPLRIAVNDPLSSGLSEDPAGAGLPISPAAFHVAATGLQGHLVLRDCKGNLHPGAAVSWRRGDEGRTWTFVLDEDLTGVNGAPLSASTLSNTLNSRLQAVPSSVVARVEANGVNELVIHLNDVAAEMPAALLGPDFALPVVHDGQAVVELMDARGRDGRDLLEEGIDGLLTRDPAVIDYARLQSQWAVLPVAWDATYVLAVSDGITQIQNTQLPEPFKQELVRDVVPGAARPFQPSQEWWMFIENCRLEAQGVDVETGSAGQADLGYALSDPVARALAERLAALSGGDIAAPGADVVQQVLPRGERRWLPRSVTGRASLANMPAFLLPLPRTSFDVCRDAVALATQLPGLVGPSGSMRYVFYPLVDVRPAMILRRDRASVVVDDYGRLYFLTTKIH